ncbi:hypothetical protein JCM19992_24710 [Thermostilla marina]
MSTLIEQYRMDPTTWLYVSSLMTIGIYFRFYRFFSIRNLDLIGLIALAPGLLLLRHGPESAAYLWLFGVLVLFLIRLMIDPALRRRPLVAPNLSSDGITFTVLALFAFLIASVFTERAVQVEPTRWFDPETAVAEGDPQADAAEEPLPRVPGFLPFYRFAGVPVAGAFVDRAEAAKFASQGVGTGIKVVAVLAHFAIVIGLIVIGTWHFDNFQGGIAAAALYLLLPYTAQFTLRLDHILPGAFLVWAVATYRRPVISGLLIGASMIVFYPVALVPLWAGFYRKRGLLRFLFGVVAALGCLVLLQWALWGGGTLFREGVAALFGRGLLSSAGLDGFWEYHAPALRIPILATLAVLVISLGLWPLEKDFGNLLSGTTSILIGCQFVHGYQGGIYMAWFLPSLVLVIFRPTLIDRTAERTVPERWFAPIPEGRDPIQWLRQVFFGRRRKSRD